jgi:hypothetical protein
MILVEPTIDAAEFERRAGWTLKPQGACKGDLCVPLPVHDGTLRAQDLDERLGMALVRDDARNLWALGPESVGGRALSTAQAPDLQLPDKDGNVVSLRSLRGQKVLLLAWASW